MSALKPKHVRRRGSDRLTETMSLKMSEAMRDALAVHAIRRGEHDSEVARRGIALLLSMENDGPEGPKKIGPSPPVVFCEPSR